MRVEQVIFSSGERLPMLLDDDDLPVPEACEWFLRRRHLALQTLMRNSGEVLVIHRWARKRRMNIYDRIRSGKQFTEADLTSLIEELSRPQPTSNKVAKLAVSRLSSQSGTGRTGGSMHKTCMVSVRINCVSEVIPQVL